MITNTFSKRIEDLKCEEMKALALQPEKFLSALVQEESETPDCGRGQIMMKKYLQSLGFQIHDIKKEGVASFYAEQGTNLEGKESNLCFLGHSDVVPALNLEDHWSHPPYSGKVIDGVVWGRGSEDMKGAIAAWLCALGEVAQAAPDSFREGLNQKKLSIAISGSEEGNSDLGAGSIVDYIKQHNISVTDVIVGEPTSSKQVGDTLKVGRRGSLSMKLTYIGKAGHVAYPHQVTNPTVALTHFQSELLAKPLDKGFESQREGSSVKFDPSTAQVVELWSKGGATNITPLSAGLELNIRFNPKWTLASLEVFLRHLATVSAQKHHVEVQIDIQPNSEAFLGEASALQTKIAALCERTLGRAPVLSTSGGASDGRYFRNQAPVIELGLVNCLLHQIDERISIQDLYKLKNLYRDIIKLHLNT